MGTIPKWVVNMAKSMACKQMKVIAKILTKKYGSDRVPPAIPLLPVAGMDGYASDSDSEFWDATEEGDFSDHVLLTGEHVPLPARVHPPQPGSLLVAAASRPDSVVQEHVTALVAQLQSAIKTLNDRIDRLPERKHGQAHGIFLSWRSFILLLAWPLLTLLLYHTFLKKKKLT